MYTLDTANQTRQRSTANYHRERLTTAPHNELESRANEPHACQTSPAARERERRFFFFSHRAKQRVAGGRGSHTTPYMTLVMSERSNSALVTHHTTVCKWIITWQVALVPAPNARRGKTTLTGTKQQHNRYLAATQVGNFYGYGINVININYKSIHYPNCS